MPVIEAHDLGTEADREGFDPDPTPARDQEMAEFVEEDDNRQDEQEAEERVHLPESRSLRCLKTIQAVECDYLVVLRGLCKPRQQGPRLCPGLGVDGEHVF